MKLKDTGPGVVLKGNARKQAISQFVQWVERNGGSLRQALQTHEIESPLTDWTANTSKADRQVLFRKIAEPRRWRNRPEMTKFPVRA
jgi:hypothetical protein